jgi:hypothetical protein
MKNRTCLLLVIATLAVAASFRAAPAAPVPPPWVPYDIGTFERSGGASLDARGLWTLRAHNGDVLQSVDSVFFIGQPLEGDGSMVALLLGQEGGHPEYARAGVMVREESAAGARNVFFGMTSGHGLGLTMRRVPGFPGADEGADTRYGPRQFPVWLRLQRQGDAITPFVSNDAFGWVQVHAPILLPGLRKDALVGLAASTLFNGPMTAIYNNPTVLPGQVSPIVQASAGNSAVLLHWSPVNGAVGYLVRRSSPDIPGFAADVITPRPILETSFVDTRLPNGRPFRYLVSPLFKEGDEPVEGWATAVTATPVSTPENLFGADINLEATRLAGGILFDPSAGVYRITGSGGDIWDTSDRCFFASRLVTGNFQATARVLDKPDRKAGLMIRESLDGPSRMVLLAGTQADGVVYQYREQTGGGAAWPGRPAVSARDFTGTLTLRLVREGATVTPFLSADGVTFMPAGPPRTFDPPLADSLYVGYAVTSQDPGRIGTSSFSDLTIR